MSFPEYQMPQAQCPNCGYEMDFASSTTGFRKPEQDDFTVCIKCAAVLRYNADLSLRKASRKEVPADLRPEITKIQFAIALTKKQFDNKNN